MASEVFQLALLLTAKDAASGTIDRFGAKLRSLGKDGIEAEKQLNKIRANLNRDLAIGGVGVAGLGLIKNGVDAAGNFQASMTELRTTLAQTTKGGQIDLNALGADMLKAEAIALKLGNALPGTTQDFISMIQTLKQGGLETKTILDGAAESVANLAVANNAVPKDIAKDFAQFGQIYKLRAEEYKGVADIFSRIYTSKGIDSGELIQSSKYFQGRAGNALGMTGLKGADESVRLMSYLQKQGLESSQAGTSASTFFVQLAKNKKALAELKKEYGITFDLFDKQGQFKGIDNAVRELEKLKKLNPEQMLVALNKLGGEEGSMAGTALVQGGFAGWTQFNAEVNKSISLTDKTKMKAADYNNQMEALSGTLENLKVTVFEPMLPSLTSAAEGINKVVGSVQGFAKANPNLSKTVITLGAMASSAMVLYSGFKLLTGGIQLFKLASAVSGSGGLLTYLKKAKEEVTDLDTKVNNLGGKKTMNVGVQIVGVMGLEYIIGQTISHYLTMLESEKAAKEKRDSESKTYTEDVISGRIRGKRMVDEKPGAVLTEGKNAFEFLNRNNDELKQSLKGTGFFENLTRSLKDIFFTGGVQNLAQSYDNLSKTLGTPSFQDLTGVRSVPLPFLQSHAERVGNLYSDSNGRFSPERTGEQLSKNAPSLRDPSAMAGFLYFIRHNLPQDQSQKLEQGASKAFPVSDAYNKALQLLPALEAFAKQQAANTTLLSQQGQQFHLFDQGLAELNQPFSLTNTNVGNLGDSASKAFPQLNSVSTSANNASASLDSLSDKIASWQPPAPQAQTFVVPNSFAPSGKGQPSIKTNFANSHSLNSTLPPHLISQNPSVFPPSKTAVGGTAQEARQILSTSARNTQNFSVNYSPQITVNGDSKTAKAEFQAMLNDHSREIDRIVARQMQNGRVRA